MDDARRAKFENMMQETKGEITWLESEIEEELAKVKERIAALQKQKKAQLAIYDGYCQLLSVENEFAADDEEEDEEDFD